MASVFQRGRSDVWLCAFRAWDERAQCWRWVQRSTGTTDKTKAAGIAATLARASEQAKAGGMTRDKALRLVDDILRLAGCEVLTPTPSVRVVADGLLRSGLSEGTARKYRAQLAALASWAGARIDRAVDIWTADDVREYYAHVRDLHSGTTANDHLRFVSMIFGRAVSLGLRAGNPVDAIDRQSNDSVSKETITRDMCAKLLRATRRAKAQAWTALIALGWHTGHRIQDLLDLTRERINGDLLTITPRKKGKKGREVVLPVPRWAAGLLVEIGSFEALRGADNRNGRVSEEFQGWLRAAGIDSLPVVRGTRTVHRISFHSFRHSMASRLTAAGVSGELARLVTDHDSPTVQRRYVHSEVSALRSALAASRRISRSSSSVT